MKSSAILKFLLSTLLFAAITGCSSDKSPKNLYLYEGIERFGVKHCNDTLLVIAYYGVGEKDTMTLYPKNGGYYRRRVAFGGYWWLAKFCPLSSLLIVLNQQLVKSCTMRQNFDGTKMGQNRRKIKPRPLCSEYPYQNTLVPSTKVQICPVKNEQMNLFLSFITHFSIILYHDRFFKVSDTLLHVLPLNNVSLIIVHCSRQMPIIRIGICTLLLSDLIQILRL